jgi:KDO2-lipid IV(A) lauroyltransferase
VFHPEVHAPEEGGRPQVLAAMSQACADALAEGIRQAPHDWHMLQRVFLADLVPEPVDVAPARTSRAH